MRRSYLLVFSCVLIVLTALLTACRGDWYYELPNGYLLDRSSAHSIYLIKKDPEPKTNTFVLKNYYVSAVSVVEEYIFTSGIPTKDMYATDEELAQTDRTYYAVNYKTAEILGPFVQEDELKAQVSDALRTSQIEWIYTKDINLAQ